MLSFVGVLLFLLSIHAVLNAGESEDFSFAKKLRRDGMFVAAAEEFLRFAQKYPASALRPSALMNAGESYMQAGKAGEALKVFETFLDEYPGHENACPARFHRGRILKALHRYRDAAGEFLAIPEAYVDCRFVAQAMLEAGDCLLSAGDSEEAVRVLYGLIRDRGKTDIAPRARLSLAIALTSMGRDLESDKILRELISNHPKSPMAAHALLMLGEKELARGDLKKSEEYFRKVKTDFDEKALQERASVLMIEIHSQRGDERALLNEARNFLDRHTDSESRGDVYQRAIDAAWNLGDDDRALALITSCTSEEAVPDSTGALHLLRGKILSRRGRHRDALKHIKDFRYQYPQSPLLKEAFLIEAELQQQLDNPAEAARLYHLALLEWGPGNERIHALKCLAEISARDLGDTLSALRYFEMIVAEDISGETAEEALWHASSIREARGDTKGARRGYGDLMTRFPGGAYEAAAREGMMRLELGESWGEDVAKEIARTAVAVEEVGSRLLRIGVILIDRAGDADGARSYLEKALERELPDSLRAEGMYHLGKARMKRYAIARSRGENAGGERKKALELWLKVARDYVGTHWGGRGHRAYLDQKFPEYKISERLARIDEFLSYYGEGEGRWWALSKKVEFFYQLAQEGDTTAADNAITMCRQLIGGTAPVDEVREVTLKYGYLLRMRGDLPGAAAAFEDFVSQYGDDHRSALVLFDLGETLLNLRRYTQAGEAFDRCLAKHPTRSLTGKCLLRKGDCLYYRHEFKAAADVYGELADDSSHSEITAEATYRKALALEQLGEDSVVEALLNDLAESRDTSPGLRVRVLRKLGMRMLDERQYGNAKPFLEELLALQRSPENFMLVAEAELGSGAYEQAVQHYTSALKYEGTDTCGLLAGRIKARIHLREFKEAERDLQLLLARCPGYDGVRDVMLEKGKVELEDGNYTDADSTLYLLRTRYPDTREASDALYYLALCDMKRGGYREATDKLNRFLGESPHSPLTGNAYFKLASAHVGAGQLNLAATNYALAAETLTEGELAYLAWKNLGRVYQELDNWEKAADTWRRVTELFPEREEIVEIFFNLGFSYNQTGRHELAYEVYKRIPDVTSTAEQRGRAHYWSGMSLKHLGRFAEAVREFLRVPYLKTGGMWGVTSKLEAASCYERMGESDQAEKIYRSVISSHGADSDWGRVATEALERLLEGKEQGEGKSRNDRESRSSSGGGERGDEA